MMSSSGHLGAGSGTSIHLPYNRDGDGTWRAAAELPDQARDALTDTILQFMVDAGLAQPKQITGMPQTKIGI